jgi:hypothetical protein
MKSAHPVRKLRIAGHISGESASIGPRRIYDGCIKVAQNAVELCDAKGRCKRREKVIDDD